MTPTDLPDLMRRRADAPTFRTVDLDAVVRTGTRLRRRRRAGTAAAGVALAGLIGGSVALLTTTYEPRAVDPATSVSPADRPLSYSLDGVLHVGERTLRPTGGVAAYVEVGDSFAVVGDDGRVRLVGPDGDTSVLSAGQPDLTGAFVRLVTDGRWVAWVTPDSGPQATAHYYDTTTGRSVEQGLELAQGRTEFSPLVSLDAGRAYLVAADGPSVTTLPQDGRIFEIRALSGPLPDGETFVDARGGSIARYAQGLLVGPSWDLAKALDGPPVLESRGVLSPDGTAFAPDADTIRIVTLDGADVTPAVGPRYAFFSTVYRWLDDDTVAVIAAEAEEGPYALLRCEVAGPCTTEADLADPDGLQLPVGSPIGD